MKQMKQLTLGFFLALSGLVLASSAHADEALMKAKGCAACHTVDKMLVGPAYKDVARKYAGQKEIEAKLAESILKGTGPNGKGWQKEGKAALATMPANAQVKPDEATKLAKWILTLK